MGQFDDRTGKTWTLAITLGFARRNCPITIIGTKGENYEVDLIDPPEEFFTVQMTNRVITLGLIFALVEDQHDWEETSPPIDQFADRFGGEEFEAALEVLYQEVANFFPQMRTILMASRERQTKVREMLLTKHNEMLSDENLERMINEIEFGSKSS